MRGPLEYAACQGSYRTPLEILPDIEMDLPALIAAGRVIPATVRGPFVMPPGEIDETNAASNALIAMREEERW